MPVTVALAVPSRKEVQACNPLVCENLANHSYVLKVLATITPEMQLFCTIFDDWHTPKLPQNQKCDYSILIRVWQQEIDKMALL